VVVEQSYFRLKSPQNSILPIYYSGRTCTLDGAQSNRFRPLTRRLRQVGFNTYHTCVCDTARNNYKMRIQLPPSYPSLTDYLLPVAATTPLGFKWSQSRTARDATCLCRRTHAQA